MDFPSRYVIAFRPGEVDGYVAVAADLSVAPSAYTYSKHGSTIVFTPKQLHEFVSTLQAAIANPEYVETDTERRSIEETIKRTRKQMWEQRSAQANPQDADYNAKLALAASVGLIAVAAIYYATRPSTLSSGANNVVLQPGNMSAVDNAGITVTPPIGGLWVAPSPYAGTAAAIPIPALPAGSPATTTQIAWAMNGQAQNTALTLTSS